MNELFTRLQRPTPRFFRHIRNAGLLLTGLSGAILTAPVALPSALITLAGYLAVAGAVAGTVSQAAVNDSTQP